MDSETTKYIWILIGLVALLIWVLSSKAKQGNQAQLQTDEQLKDLNLDTDSYFI